MALVLFYGEYIYGKEECDYTIFKPWKSTSRNSTGVRSDMLIIIEYQSCQDFQLII